MVLAHAPVNATNHATSTLQFLGGFAPVLFFAVNGVTSKLQSKRARPDKFLLLYLFIGYLGLSWNGVIQGDFFSNPQFEMIQIIATGTMVVFVIERAFKPSSSMYLILAIVAFCIHLVLHDRLPDFPLRNFILTPGVFPVFPWLFLFFAGVNAYYCNNKYNLFLGAALVTLLLALSLSGVQLDLGNKWNMSVGYFLLSTIGLLVSFLVSRKYLHNLKTCNPILYLGRNSLLFLFVHISWCRVSLWPTVNPFAIWISIAALSLLSVGFLQFAKHYYESYFSNPFTHSIVVWCGLAILITAIPLLVSFPRLIVMLEIFAGTLFALNYRSLSEMIKCRPASIAPTKARRSEYPKTL